MRARGIMVVGCLAACGGSGSTSHDASPDSMEIDAPLPIDAVPGTLFADPPDPIGAPCAGRRGFPGLPMIHQFNGTAALQLADVTGDAKLDLAYLTVNTVAIAAGNGDGTFAAPTYFTTAYYPSSLRLIDVDGDTKKDIVFASSQSQYVGFALNLGSGTFGVTQYVNAGAFVTDLVVADVNADTKPDIVALLAGTGNIAVALRGASAFGIATTVAIGSTSARSLAVGDLASDGRPELVVSTGQGITIVPNTAPGFGPPTAYALANVAEAVVVRDVNGDNKPDVVAGTGDSIAASFAVFLNQGTGTLAAGVTYSAVDGIAGAPRALSIADFDGDGAVDVFVAGASTELVSIVHGSGTGTFGAPESFYLGVTSTVAAADLDADGHIDVAIGSYRGVTLFSNTGATPELDFPPRLAMAGVTSFRRLEVADATGDGQSDVIMNIEGDFGIPPMLAVSAFGTGTFSTSPTTSVLPYRSPNILVADTNNDSRRDVIGYGGGELEASLNNGDGSLTPMASLATLGNTISAVAGDINHDAIRDLVLANSGGGGAMATVVWARGLGNGNFAPPAAVWTATSADSQANSVAVGDVNEDGNLDVVFDVSGDFVQVVLLGMGNGSFAPPLTTSGLASYHLTLHDMNGDTHLDVVRSGSAPTSVSLGDGTGGFGAPIASTSSLFAIRFADINADGKVDIAGLLGEDLGIALGNGDGSLAPVVYYSAPRNDGWDLAVTDVDGDGQLDIVTGSNRNNLMILRGRCFGP